MTSPADTGEVRYRSIKLEGRPWLKVEQDWRWSELLGHFTKDVRWNHNAKKAQRMWDLAARQLGKQP